MNDDGPLMLTSEPWSDLESRRTRAYHQGRAAIPNTIEARQKASHENVMEELKAKGGTMKVSRRPYYWAQGGSRDMFTQAVARNVVAISKEKQSPDTKQGPGPVLTPNEELGRQMLSHREEVISHYQRVVQRSGGERDEYQGFLDQAEINLADYDKQRQDKTLKALERQQAETLYQMELESVPDLRERVGKYSLEHDLNVDRLDAARKTKVSWPGHEDWESHKKSMKGTPSKLTTLGHGKVRSNVVSEEFIAKHQSQLHGFDEIVESQIQSGLPLDKVAKRLDACNAATKPMSQSDIQKVRQMESKPGPTNQEVRSGIMKDMTSSTQQFSQAYFDKGVKQPEVKGASKGMARFPNTRPNPTYRNEVEIDDETRDLRRNHTMSHGPVFQKRPQSD